MKWETVIGVEIHIETNTKTKMFCACASNYFGAKPNTHTCPVCLGLPGALPYTNMEAIEKCIKIGLALGCSISKTSLFERKNYFYPDLPKGYQISQYRWPLCTNGTVDVEGKYGKKTIRINRAHQEEDTGKLTHRGSKTMIDFNRSGVPLVEIVTEADFRHSSEVRDYSKKIQALVRSIGVSSADMEKGDMRLEANVSVRPQGSKKLPDYRVELKNINSFKFISDAIDFEVERQIALLEKGEKVDLQTRGYNENKRQTFLQRSKEEANDYRYFPEPDIPPLSIPKSEIERIRAELPKLPEQRVADLVSSFSIPPVSGAILVRQGNDALFEKLAPRAHEIGINARGTANYIINRAKDTRGKTIEEILGKMSVLVEEKITDSSELAKIAKETISDHDQAASDYRGGNVNAIQVLLGAIMKKTKGKADPLIARKTLESLLK